MMLLGNLKPVFAEERLESVFDKDLTVNEDDVLVLKGEVEGDKQQIKKELSRRILKRLDLSNCLDDPTLKTDIKFANVCGDKKEELIVALSLSKDNGLLAIFIESNTKYQLKLTIKDMLPIVGLNFIELPKLDYKVIVADEYLDERFGAFFESTSRSIYLIDKDLVARKLWERVVYLKVAEPLEEGWLIKLEEADISFNSKGEIIVRAKRQELKVEDLKQSEGQELNSLDIEEIYHWNQDELSFTRVESS